MIQTVEEFAVLLHGNEKAMRHAAVTGAVWERLLEAGFPKTSVLLNKRLPIEVLRSLASDPDPEVRALVAAKRAAAPLLGQLAEDADEGVRARVVHNAKAPEAVLRRLTQDPVGWVAGAARERLNLAVPAEPKVTAVLERVEVPAKELLSVCGVELWAEADRTIWVKMGHCCEPIRLAADDAEELAETLLELVDSVVGCDDGRA